MSTIEWFIIIACGVISIILIFFALSKDEDATGATILGTILGMICTMGIISVMEDPKPQPIDVYRGKTTLQITYQDSVAIDSTVVWKK